jgi:hypothetical protein
LNLVASDLCLPWSHSFFAGLPTRFRCAFSLFLFHCCFSLFLVRGHLLVLWAREGTVVLFRVAIALVQQVTDGEHSNKNKLDKARLLRELERLLNEMSEERWNKGNANRCCFCVSLFVCLCLAVLGAAYGVRRWFVRDGRVRDAAEKSSEVTLPEVKQNKTQNEQEENETTTRLCVCVYFCFCAVDVADRCRVSSARLRHCSGARRALGPPLDVRPGEIQIRKVASLYFVFVCLFVCY